VLGTAACMCVCVYACVYVCVCVCVCVCNLHENFEHGVCPQTCVQDVLSGSQILQIYITL